MKKLLLVPVLVAPVFGACSSDSPSLADRVARLSADRLSIDRHQVTASCPDDADLHGDADFTCTIQYDGQPLEVLVHPAKEDPSVEVRGKAFATQDLLTTLTTQLTEQLPGSPVTSLECGLHDHVLIPTDGTVQCRATDAAGAHGTVTIGLDPSGGPSVRDVVPG